MGFFSFAENKVIGTARIKFYGENEASVQYETNVSDTDQKEMDVIQTFALYYAKMLFNLNRGEHADGLIGYVGKAIEETFSENGLKRPDILAPEQRLVEPKESGATKVYSGEMVEKGNKTRVIQTHLDAVGEGYYVPISTVMFLQWLIKNLSDNSLAFLILSLGGMHKFYRESGDYFDMKSIVAAPSFGFTLAGQILSESGKS